MGFGNTMLATRKLFRRSGSLVGRLALAVGTSASLIATTTPTLTAEQASLDGAWSGSGTVTFPSGGKEGARCKASFTRRSTDSYAMSALCATPSGKVAQTAQLDRITANRFAGQFQNTEYGISGQINIVVRGNSLSAALNGGGATASLNLSK